MTCDFCAGPGGEVLWQDGRLRVIAVDEPGYPGFCRVVWNDHVKEMTDLDAPARACFLHAVFAVERALRDLLHPDKVNLACLGNMTPHLHWHVIPRYADDPHFPQPVWAAAVREARRAAPPGWSRALAERLAGELGPAR
jgi:diadenosine tetraphosphate (Ap4A) HIT family hydrolase